MGRVRFEDLPAPLQANTDNLLERVNKLLAEYGSSCPVSSGYRRPEDNAKVPSPKPRSAHLTCEAIDLLDRDRKLTAFLRATPRLLEDYGLYMEHWDSTPTWVHLQTRPPKSGNRVFYP